MITDGLVSLQRDGALERIVYSERLVCGNDQNDANYGAVPIRKLVIDGHDDFSDVKPLWDP